MITPKDDLRALFAPHGDLLEVKLPRDGTTGKVRGFGFVQFARVFDAQKAMAATNATELKGRLCLVHGIQNPMIMLTAAPRQHRRPQDCCGLDHPEECL